MQVVRATEFGGPEVLVPTEMPDPTAGSGEVVVDVSVADVLFLDLVIRRGSSGPWSVRPPYVPGSGVAGRVSSVGERVDKGWVGRRVAAKPGTPNSKPEVETVAESAVRTAPTGGYAERAVVPVRALIPVPDGLSFRDAAALINDGMTAMLLAETAKVLAGERVLVAPAGGGAGSLLVQLAHTTGARVIAAARGQRKLALARELGAEAVVDYSRQDWPDDVRRASRGMGPDVVLDGVGGQIGRAAFETTSRGGRFLAYGAPSGGFTRVDEREARERPVTASSILDLKWMPGDEQRLAGQAITAAAAGRIRPVVGQTYPLSKAADAHTAIESRDVLGKTLLLLN